jgi:cytoskeleton protein RodZ
MSETPAAQPVSGAPGPQLKAEREKRGLSLQKAANELHLDAWVIEALEAGDYQRIGAAVYAKGHLKRYAGLLGLPAAAIMEGYETRAPASEAVTLNSTSARMAGAAHQPQMSNLSPGRSFGLAVAVLVVVGVFWWRPWHQRFNPPAAAQPVAAPKEEQQQPVIGAPKASPAIARDEPAAAAPAAMTATPTDATAAAVPGAGHARLRLSFSANSWVDVHDATGKRAFAGNGLANSVKTISGVAPMRVFLGAGNGVTVEINDRAVAIGPQFFAGDVARFEAGADGVLRRDPVTTGERTRNSRPRG